MNKVISFIKSIRLGQILTVLLAGILLFINTACAGNAQAKMPKVGATDPGPHPVGQTQPYEGGMNNFSDTAPGQAAKGTAERTKALIDRAERDISTKRVDSVEQYVENYRTGAPLGERTEKLTENIKEGVKNAAEDATGLGDRVSKMSDRAADKTKELGNKIQRGAENVTDNTRTSGDTAKALKDKVEDAAKSAGRKIQDAID
jgi:uncharacterized phage infection (PIP) family protein YhgE